MNVGLKWIAIFNVFLAHLYVVCEGMRPARARASHRAPLSTACPMPKIKNGTVRMQRGGRMAYFFCAPGFEIHGAMNIVCQMGRWKQDLPICMKPGCSAPAKRENGFVMIDEKRQKVMLFCQDGYLSASSTIAYCDGRQWDRELGECRPDKGHTKSCDFETSDLCEWTQDTENDFPWIRKSGWTSYEKLEFGPKHDHTIGKPLEGHYMVAEATNSRSTQKSRLWSPFYSKDDSKDACFRFYYHMYGSKIGQLRVIMKPSEMNIDDVLEEHKYILFDKQNSQGNQWNKEVFQLEPIESDFQIIFEATGSNGLISDIAIDDVALMKNGDCVKALSPESVTEEIGGIFDVQSCANRCTETQSVRVNGSKVVAESNGSVLEKCDCHADCLSLGTCCTDYQAKCLESESTESDVVTTPLDDAIDKNSDIVKKITQTIEKMLITTPRAMTNKTTNITTLSTPTPTSTRTTPKPILNVTISTTSKSTLKPVSITTPTTTNTIVTTKSTVKPTLNTKTTTTPAPKTTVKISQKTNVKPAQIPIVELTTISTTAKTSTLLPTGKPTTKLISTIKTSTAKKITQKITDKYLPAKMTEKLTKSTKKAILPKTSPLTLKPTKSTVSTTKLTTKSTQIIKITKTTTVATIATKVMTFKSTKRAISVTPSIQPNKALTTTDVTSNAMLMPSDTGKVISLSTIITICILLTLKLIGWKYFNANKWNQFNSQQIQFKSNYPTEGTEESLIRSDSFIIDDSFDGSLIDNCDAVSIPCNQIEITSKAKKVVNEKINGKSMSKSKRNAHRFGRDCDQYSEERCLTADDEQFDFTLQTTL